MNITDLVPWRSRSPARREQDEPGTVMRREMNRLFEDFFRGFDLASFEREGGRAFYPSVNVSETDEAIEATFELPGVSEEDVDVTLTRDGLIVSGEKREETKEEGKDYYHQERSYGYFRRTIPLSADAVDRDKVEATFDKGVLTVTLPKREEARRVSRRIPVKTG